MAATVEQYAAAQRRVAETAKVTFSAWLARHPEATREQISEACLATIHQFAGAARLLANTWYDDVTGDSHASDT